MDDKNNSDIICIFIIDGKYSYLNAFTISCWRLRMSDVNLSLSLSLLFSPHLFISRPIVSEEEGQ